MIEWLNDNSGAVQAGVGLVLALTLFAILWYACETRKLAKEARRQAEASMRVAEATLRPVMSLWEDGERCPPECEAAEVVYTVSYTNIGNGPALNIRFLAGPIDGRWLEQGTRVSVGAGQEERPIKIKVPLPIPEQLFVAAEYDDAAHSRWKTTLKLEREGKALRLTNAGLTVAPIEGQGPP